MKNNRTPVTINWRMALLAGAASFLIMQEAMAGDKAGVIGNAEGNVTAVTPAGEARALKAGDAVFQDETIRTAPGARAQILFLDKSALTLTPGSEVKIDNYVFDPASATGSMTVKGAKGAFRFIGGALSKNEHVEIKTPVSTIGIRGGIAETHIDAGGQKADAVFIYGKDMVVQTNDGGKVTLTEFGTGASVQQGMSAPMAMSQEAVAQSLGQFNDAAGGKGAENGSAPNEGAKSTQGKDSGASGKGEASAKDQSSGQSGEKSESNTASGAQASDSGAAPVSTQSNPAASTPVLPSLVSTAVTTAATDTTQAATQQNFSASAPAVTHEGIYGRSANGSSSGKAELYADGSSLKGKLIGSGATSGQVMLTSLPRPTGPGNYTLGANDALIDGVHYAGNVTVSPQQSMYYYSLTNPVTAEMVLAVAGIRIDSANWAQAASVSAAQNASTNGIGFYRIMADLLPNGGGLYPDPSGSVAGGGRYGMAVDWTRNRYFGGGIRWGSSASQPPSMIVTFGKVTPTGAALLQGKAFDFTGEPATSLPHARSSLDLGFDRAGAYVYGSGAAGVDGFVVDAIMPSNLSSLPSDPFLASGERHLVPVMANTPSAAAVAATGARQNGAFQGYAAGYIVNTSAANMDATQYWNDQLPGVQVNTSATGGTVNGSIAVFDPASVAAPVTANFGGGTGTESAYLANGIYGAQQQAVQVGANNYTGMNAAQGAIASADLIADVQNHCSQCDYVHWGVWAAEFNTGTTSVPQTQVVQMMPYVAGEPTIDLVNKTSVTSLGVVNYSGAVYGTALDKANNILRQQEGSFTSAINLGTRQLNSFSGTIGGVGFGTSGAYTIISPSGGTSSFHGIPVSGTGANSADVYGNINGALFGPNAENMAGNFKITKVSTNTDVTGVYLGSRP